MVHLTKLPSEILRNIVSNLCSHCRHEYDWPRKTGTGQSDPEDTLALFNLCLVSRHFIDAAQEVLYHSFDPNVGRSYRPKGRLEPFFRTITARPDLARLVRVVFLRDQLVEALDFNQCRDLFHKHLLTQDVDVHQIYQPDGGPNNSKLTGAERAFLLEENTLDSVEAREYISVIGSHMLTVLLSLLPHVTYLGIADSLPWDMGWQLDISLTTLEALGVETFSIKQFECDRAPKNLFTRSPHLETFITEGRGDIPKLPSVKNLHFRSLPSVPGKQLEHAIDACRSLSTLSVMAADAYPPVNLEYLDQPRLHATLESIHIDLCYAYGNTSLSFMPTLNHFTKLRKLFAVATSIYGKKNGWYTIESSRSLYKSLPPSIVSVTVMEYEPTPPDRLLTDLIDIAGSKSAKFPNLTKK